MLGYINEEDLRSCCVKELCSQKSHVVTSDQSKIEEADYLYLGLNGSEYQNTKFKKGSRIYTLIKNPELERICTKQQCKYHCLYDEEVLVQGNTYLTSEGVIGYMINTNHRSIYDSTILVIGYGHCGRDLARKLKALQAKVTICNRGYYYKEKVIKQGYQYVCLDRLSLKQFDYIINTVPATILNKEILQTKETHAKIYDIASFPYGVAKENRDKEYYILSSLPSKYAYESAAMLIYQAMMKKEDQYVNR